MGAAKAALEHGVRQLASELGPWNIRVNAISAGPVATLSARGISGFTGMAAHHRKHAPLRRDVERREVGDAALFLCSDLASGITGEILYVDAGYNIMAI
jgi:enoyl-[acyl-carrier protein] reductase I